MNIIQPEDSPQKVNKLLMDKWGIGLFKFAQVFAVSPGEILLQKRSYPFTFQEISEIKNTLKRMQDDLFKRARYLDKLLDRNTKRRNAQITDDELIEEMSLKDFFLKYYYPREIIVNWFEKTRLLGRPGTGINKKTKIAVGWGNLVAKHVRRINWKILGDLYYWLWEKIYKQECYKEWTPVSGIEDYLKIRACFKVT